MPPHRAFVGLIRSGLASTSEPSPKLFEFRLRFFVDQIMAALSTYARSTLCSSCIRRIASDDISQLWFPFHRQLRGKKKSAKRPTTINVKLLEDIEGFGRKGNAHCGLDVQYVC